MIKKTRKKLKITQMELSKLSGVSIATIKRIERGGHHPNYKTLIKIYHVLGIGLTSYP